MVVIKPYSTPNSSTRIFAMGARQFVVQDPIEMMLCFEGIIVFLIHAKHHGHIRVFSRGGDHHFLCPCLQVLSSRPPGP